MHTLLCAHRVGESQEQLYGNPEKRDIPAALSKMHKLSALVESALTQVQVSDVMLLTACASFNEAHDLDCQRS